MPPELVEKCNEDVNILLEHHLDETFVHAPKPLIMPEKVKSEEVVSSKILPPMYYYVYEHSVQESPAVPKIDESKPKAGMRIRLISGKAINVEFNLSSKVNDIYQYVSEY